MAVTLPDGSSGIEMRPDLRGGLFVEQTEADGYLFLLPNPALFNGEAPFRNDNASKTVRKFFDGVSVRGGSIVRIRPAVMVPISGMSTLWQCVTRGEIVQN